ncbi:hypothetical protein BO71DRAFT_405929 [Aspergillus ellipticus CBS 707.79]|uniref:Uncharacterized protein n=1 Tax=Aspergillus ellipticus CBS 707.79 TaxID=1448320 RepID=A0A319DQH8_9EURO|nr:hypothetical protein BO71DRAFT_405929 [Aspergillus ellipticus CBS 707.79]
MAPSAKTTRYSNTDKLDRYYDSVFSKIPKTTRNALLVQLERPVYIKKGAKQKPITETEADEIRTLIKKLRKEPLEYFRRALQRVRQKFEESQYEELEKMLSTRKTELKYEKGELVNSGFELGN